MLFVAVLAGGGGGGGGGSVDGSAIFMAIFCMYILQQRITEEL